MVGGPRLPPLQVAEKSLNSSGPAQGGEGKVKDRFTAAFRESRMLFRSRSAMPAVLPFRPLISLCAVAVLACALAVPVRAQESGRVPSQESGRRMDRDRGTQMRGQDRSLGDSVRRFERSRGGRVLSAERMQSDGRDVNRIKAMDDRGRVRVYVDDPGQQRSQPQRSRRPRGRDD